MTLIRRPQRFGELMALPSVVDRMFDEMLTRPRTWLASEFEPTLPPLDMHGTAESVIVEASLPGVKPDDVDVSIEGDTLTIRGEFKEETKRDEPGYLLHEIRRGSFDRSVTLPADLKIDQAKAVFKDGLLTLTIPRTTPSPVKKVKVEVR
jgi:HSP20 family protein